MAAIDYNTLFTRLGKLGKIGYALAGYQSNIPATITTLISQYTGTTDQNIMGGVITQQKSLWRVMVSGIMGGVTGTAGPTMLQMVQTSQPPISTTTSALVELIRQMKADGQSVAACTVGSTGAALSTNIGSGSLVLTTKRGDGLVQENAIAEILRVQCVADSYTGGAIAGRESFGITGTPNLASLWDYDYPTGSGASSGLNAISADQDASSNGNVLTNGDMEEWSADATPQLSNWVLSVGTWGTQVQRDATAPNRGIYSLQFLPTATNTVLYQTFDDSTLGTAVSLSSLTSYAFNVWLRKLSGTISAGVLRVALVDGTGTVTNDEQGVANSFTVTLSTLTTSYTALSGVFRVKGVPASTLRLEFKLTTALVGASFLMDDAAMCRPVAPYPGAPGMVLFSGATPYVTGDGYDVTNTNNRAGASYLGTFQSLYDRLYGMRNLGLLLPSSGSPTQLDTKISA